MQEREAGNDYRIDARWILAGLSVTTLLAAADIGKTWYWFPRAIPISPVVYSLSILFVYVSWVGIGVFIGWFRRKAVLGKGEGLKPWLIHSAMSIAIGSSHLLTDSILVWLMFKPSRPLPSFGVLYAEKIVAWLPYEILAYWSCLAVFALVELLNEQRAGSAAKEREYQPHFAVKHGAEVRIVPCAHVEWIEAFDNYVILHTASEQHTLYDSMARLESSLDPNLFLRIHRSTIVNVACIKAIQNTDASGTQILLNRDRSFPVSRRRRAHIRRILAKRAGKK